MRLKLIFKTDNYEEVYNLSIVLCVIRTTGVRERALPLNEESLSLVYFTMTSPLRLFWLNMHIYFVHMPDCKRKKYMLVMIDSYSKLVGIYTLSGI